jgi:hypothetical protein
MNGLLHVPLKMVVVRPVTLSAMPCGPDGVGWEGAVPKK